jgi:uncharacterized protein YxjI
MGLAEQLSGVTALFVRQRRELAELIGFETRNKYEVMAEGGAPLGFAAEQQKGILGLILRQLLGHWRTFEIHLFDAQRQLAAKAVHPFRFFFQRLEVYLPEGALIGAVQQRFALLAKRFDVTDAAGRVVMEVRSPIWRIWTFPFVAQGREVARIEKKWSGLLSEAFTDKDNFRVSFSPGFPPAHRLLVLAAAIFVDVQYFERKAD